MRRCGVMCCRNEGQQEGSEGVEMEKEQKQTTRTTHQKFSRICLVVAQGCSIPYLINQFTTDLARHHKKWLQ